MGEKEIALNKAIEIVKEYARGCAPDLHIDHVLENLYRKILELRADTQK